MSVDPETSKTPETRPAAILEALGDRRNLILVAFAGAGFLLFALLAFKTVASSGSQLPAAIGDLFRGFSQLDQKGIDTQDHLQAFEPVEELRAGYQLLWAILLLLGLQGWLLVERSFKNADPSFELCLRREGVLGLGFLLYVVIGFDVTHPASFTAGGTLPVPGFEAAWNSSAPNLLVEGFVPLVIVAALAGYALIGVRTRFLLVLAAVVTLILYPIFASWLWDDGWLARMGGPRRAFPNDEAGAGVIHLLLGTIALIVLIGSRLSIREPLPREKMQSERGLSAVFGLICIQLAFIALTGKSVLDVSGIHIADAILQGLVAAAAGAAVAGISRIRIQTRALTHTLLFGSMGGWVIVAGGVGGFEIWQAAVLGAIAGVIVIVGLAVLDSWELRDPFALVPIHFGCGGVGFLAACWSRFEPPHWTLQLVALIAMTIPTIFITTALVWGFVRKNRLSKRDPEMPESAIDRIE